MFENKLDGQLLSKSCQKGTMTEIILSLHGETKN